MSTNISKTTDKATSNMSLPRAEGSYRIISVEQHTLTIDKNGVASPILIDRAALASSISTNANVGNGRNANGDERANIENEYQAPEGKVAGSGWCDTDKRNTYRTAVARENIKTTNGAGPEIQPSMTRTRNIHHQGRWKRKGDIRANF